MKYRFHDGIVYTKICKVHILAATRKVWDQFPSVKEVSALQGCFCQGIDQGMSDEEIIDAIRLPPKLKREAVRKSYNLFIEKMVKEGYLVPEEV